MNSKRTHLLALALAAFLTTDGRSQPGAAERRGDPVSVERPEAAENSATFSFTGTLTARRSAALSPRVAGLVQTADAEAGHEAKRGDTLVQLDDTLARLALRERESELRSAQAELQEAQRRFEEALELGERNFPRTEREARQSAVRLAEVAVARVETALERQRELIERHKVVAPFDGVVLRKRAEMGEWAETGSPVIELVSMTDLRLDAQVPQEQVELATRARDVEIRVAGRADPTLKGRVEALAPAVDPGTRTFLVRIAIDDPPSTARPGMSAQAIFRPTPDQPPLMISRDAIIRSADGETLVWAVEEREGELRAVRRPVTLGATRGDRVEALSGVNADDRIVVRGNEALRDDQLVRVVESSATRRAEER